MSHCHILSRLVSSKKSCCPNGYGLTLLNGQKWSTDDKFNYFFMISDDFHNLWFSETMNPRIQHDLFQSDDLQNLIQIIQKAVNTTLNRYP